MAVVLCIDDDALALGLRRLLLEHEGHVVITAEDGSAGLRALKAFHVDIVVLDFNLPDLRGDAVSARIREAFPLLPIVIDTGSPDEVPEATNAMVSTVLSKGSSPYELSSLIRTIVGGSGKRPMQASGPRIVKREQGPAA